MIKTCWKRPLGGTGAHERILRTQACWSLRRSKLTSITRTPKRCSNVSLAVMTPVTALRIRWPKHFSVLARMPTHPKLQPPDVLAILERNIFPHFILVTLAPADYPEAIRALAAKGLGGGRIYDLLHLRAASKLALDQIYTFNASEWKLLAPELASLISVPPAVVTS